MGKTKLKYEYQSSGDKLDANDMFGRDESGGSDAPECKESETSKYVPHGLEYLDDDDILIDIDSDVEEIRSLFPREKSRKNIIPGGPQKPDMSMCTELEGKVLLQHYAKARKAYSQSKSSSFTGEQNE
jgi:hypothetical protein